MFLTPLNPLNGGGSYRVRTFTGLSIIAGFTCMVTNMVMTARAGRVAHVDTEYGPYESSDDEEVALGAV